MSPKDNKMFDIIKFNIVNKNITSQRIMSLRYKAQNTNSQHMLKLNDDLSQKKENPSEKKNVEKEFKIDQQILHNVETRFIIFM